MNTVVSVNVGLPKRFARERRRLVCRESSILSGDGGSVMTVCPSRPEARRRFGSETANELGAPVASSIPEQLPGREPASTRKGYEDVIERLARSGSSRTCDLESDSESGVEVHAARIRLCVKTVVPGVAQSPGTNEG